MYSHNRHASERPFKFRWRAIGGSLILVFGSFIPSRKKSSQVGPPLTNRSVSAHGIHIRKRINFKICFSFLFNIGVSISYKKENYHFYLSIESIKTVMVWLLSTLCIREIPKRILWQIHVVKFQMKCCMMRQFIRDCIVYYM